MDISLEISGTITVIGGNEGFHNVRSDGDDEQLGEIKKQKEMEKRQYDRMRRTIPSGDAGVLVFLNQQGFLSQ